MKLLIILLFVCSNIFAQGQCYQYVDDFYRDAYRMNVILPNTDFHFFITPLGFAEAQSTYKTTYWLIEIDEDFYNYYEDPKKDEGQRKRAVYHELSHILLGKDDIKGYTKDIMNPAAVYKPLTKEDIIKLFEK